MVLQKRQLEKAFSPKKGRSAERIRAGRINTNASQKTTNEKTSSKIKVVVRVRPKNSVEIGEQYRNAVDVIDDKMLIFDPKEKVDNFFFQGVKQKGRDICRKINKNMSFMFDNVFGNDSTNRELFECCTKDLFSSLMNGFNCSVFVYGATGAGKTHTMLGNENNPGITFLTMVELFKQIDTLTDDRSFDLGITYVEVYNETVRNLLNSSGPLHLREDNELGVIVSGVEITRICSAAELLSLLTTGNRNRTQHPTDANAESSRSHAVFQVHVRMVSRANGQVKQVKLSMIDLAGSERGSATGCTGARFKEGANINKSLLALGNCINSLADGQKHIPYRDSKLTRLLKDSLGGNCQTVMIANISPSSLSYEDTYNTLKYASRAKNIKTTIKKNIVNCDQHVGHYVQRVKDLTAEVDKLKAKLKLYESQGRAPIIKPSGTVSSTVTSAKTEKNVSPIVNNVLLTSLRTKLASLFQKNNDAQKHLLLLQSQEKILHLRIKLKEEMCERVNNLALDEECNNQVKIQMSINQFGRQSKGLSQRLSSAMENYAEVEECLKNAILEAKTENMGTQLSEYISYEIKNLNLNAAISQSQHTQKLFELCRYEMMDLHKVIMQQSSLLKQYYFLLKSTNPAMHDSSIISNSYSLMEKQVGGGNKCISWDTEDSLDPIMNIAILSLDRIRISSNVLPTKQNLATEYTENKSAEETETEDIDADQLVLCLQKLQEESKKFQTKKAHISNDDKLCKPNSLNETITLQSENDLAAPLDTRNVNDQSPIKLQPLGDFDFKKPKNLHDDLFTTNNKLKYYLSPSSLDNTFVLKKNDIKIFGENSKTLFKKPFNNENTTAAGKAANQKPSWKSIARKTYPKTFKSLNKENKPLPSSTSRVVGPTNSKALLSEFKKDAKDIKRLKDKRVHNSHPYLRSLVESTGAIKKQNVKDNVIL